MTEPRGHARTRPVVMGFLPDPRGRARIADAMRLDAETQWVSTVAGLAVAARHARPAAVILEARGQDLADACAIARELRRHLVGTAIIACCTTEVRDRGMVSAIAAAGVHDIVVRGLNDEGPAVRSVILRGMMAAAADLVMETVAPTVPDGLLRFVDAAVRRPGELTRVAQVASAIRVPRQTLGRWCRSHGFVRPEELLVWARLFLVAALLETGSRTLESIADDLRYGSPTSLRNRIRGYTGMTATQLRGGGLDIVVQRFDSRLRQLRASAMGVAKDRSGFRTEELSAVG